MVWILWLFGDEVDGLCGYLDELVVLGYSTMWL
jgi:hypothetical protein